MGDSPVPDSIPQSAITPTGRLFAALAHRYRVERELGKGGMATVYLAHDLKYDRPVALKVLRPELAASLGAERFLQEVRISAKLNHPHILTLLDSGESDGVLWYVLPFVHGESLREKLNREEQLGLDESLAIIRQIAGALDYAHREGIIHRDIKPGNILLHEGEAMLADFGIALAVSEAAGTRLTESGVSPGTPDYMSPEQAAGDTQLDQRTDVYSLAAVLYEMLAGEPPVTGPTRQAVIARLVTEPRPHLRAARDTVPDGVDDAIAKALSLVPADRFPTAGEFALALSRATEPATTSQRRRWPIVAVVAVVLVAAFAWSVRSNGKRPQIIESLVVLPLDNYAGGPEAEYFVQGMHDALTSAIGQISTLRVLSATSAMRFKGSGKSVPEIARELDVDAVIEGSVFRTGDSVRIEVRLIHAQPERRLWGKPYEGEIGDALNLIAEVSRSIAAAVEAQLTPSELARLTNRPAANPEAYDAWLRASFHASRSTGPDKEACIRYGRQAASLDTGFALAYQILADCYNEMQFVSGTADNQEMYLQAKRAAQHALALDEGLAPAHLALAWALAYYDWDWRGAEQEFRRAIELNPNFDRAHGSLGWFLSWLGRFEEALDHVRLAERLNPNSVLEASRVAMVLNLSRRHDEAISEALRAIALDSTYMFGYGRLYWAYHGKGMYAEGVKAMERAAELGGPRDVRRRGFLGHAYATVGRVTEARAILDELLSLQTRAHVPATSIAAVHVGLNDLEQAIDWLERGYERRDGEMVLLNTLSLWDPLREHPRFKAIVRRMGFPR